MDTGELFEKALDKARDDDVLELPDPADTFWSARQADALRNLVTDYLSGTGDANQSNDNNLVTIHVGQSAFIDTGEIVRTYNKAPAGALLSTMKNKENWVKEPPPLAYFH